MNDDIHSQAYLYVVGALSPEEMREYEAHLSECSDCQTKVADMRDITAQLSEAVALEPPSTLRTSVLAQIAQTPQASTQSATAEEATGLSTGVTEARDPSTRPATTEEATGLSTDVTEPRDPSAESQPGESSLRGRHAARPSPDDGDDGDDGPSEETPLSVGKKEALLPSREPESSSATDESGASNVIPLRRSWATRASAAVAAAAVVAAVIIGGWAINARNDARHDADVAAAQAAQLAQVLSAPDLQTASAGVNGGGTAAVVRSESENLALLVATDLPTLASGKVYEAWTIEGDEAPVPAGTFESAGDHTTFTLTPAAIAAGAVALTVEPDGGSDQPTTPPIVAIEVPTT